MNKKIIIIIVIILLVVGGAGSYLILGRSSSGKESLPPQIQQEVIPTIPPSELGLTLSARSDNKALILEMTKLKDISAVDYELSYTSKGNISRGAIGHIDIKPTDTGIKRAIVLGTCSDVCHYDEEVSNIKLILKITKTDGKAYQAEQGFEL